MKLPYFPKQQLDPGLFVSIFENVASQAELGQFVEKMRNLYYPWERFSQIPLPKSKFSHLELWQFIRFTTPKNQTPFLTDSQSRPFWYTETLFIRKRLHEIDLDFSSDPIMKQVNLDPEYQEGWARKGVITSIIEEAIHSSQIEGAATTRRRAKELIQFGQKPKNKHEKMILNNYATIQKIKKEWVQEAMSVDLLLRMHRELTHETLEDRDVGVFRKDLSEEDRVMVYDDDGQTVLHEPPPAATLPDRMQKLCDFINSDEPFVHPVLKAIMIHFSIGYIHPFYDGNGRVARGLFYWFMLKKGYRWFEFVSISEQIQKDISGYKKAYLYTEKDQNDLTYFIYFHLKIIEKCMAAFESYIQRKVKELEELKQKLRQIDTLNLRQLDLLNHALKHREDLEQKYTIESHQVSNGISFFTARSDLLDLAEQGFLEKQKRGKMWVFFIPPDLDSRIEGRKQKD